MHTDILKNILKKVFETPFKVEIFLKLPISYRVYVWARQMKHLQYMLMPQLNSCRHIVDLFFIGCFQQQPNLHLYHLSTCTSHVYFLACHSLFTDFSFKIHQLLSMNCNFTTHALVGLKHDFLVFGVWLMSLCSCAFGRILSNTHVQTEFENHNLKISDFYSHKYCHNIDKCSENDQKVPKNTLKPFLIAKWVHKISSSIFCLSAKTLKNKHSLC